jgi:Zn-dependent peptidase ImmA (M78 family)
LSVIKSYRFLPKEQIEHIANDWLLRMQARANFPKWKFIAEFAVDFLNLSLVWCSVPPQNGRPVFARIYPSSRLIEINEDIPEIQENHGLAQSTLAHEIGHWILHVNQDEADGNIEQLELSLYKEATEQPFLCRNINEQQIAQNNANKQLDSIEWQAQYFASCFLMPMYKLEEGRKGRDLTNWNHLKAMADELGVTSSNLKHRLKDLGWIYIPKGSKQIYKSNTTPNIQRSLFE